MAASEPPHVFFDGPAAMRAWLEANHRGAKELHVGYHKRRVAAAGRPSITWPESVAEALCFGWIDGVRRTLDDDRYAIRFTPRRPGSKWSAVNVRLIAELQAAGRMTDAGRAVFAARRDPESPGYTPERRTGTLDPARLAAFQANEPAWAFFASQPPGYRSAAAWWVMQAKQDETRDRRLATLVALSAAGKRTR